ncbi:hypothetical protein GCM10022243_18870 [Saccharothrix violaceirubra]|uniref:Superfamily II DNA/RNA helicase n=1 Tax=Saccharothrix violaceirubra TaxID=413306 RepID=A0A7W7WVL4_9PSEU|nr:DEAD/DEAH box helicase [Saccharothrix violaceirubra]MBB4965206.1 superfamily II DNA/RNA helicase [Saccharothrix violaceirubra]
MDTSVAGVVEARWGVRPEPAIARYAEPGWQLSPVPLDRSCPTCSGELHGLYRAHPDRGRQQLQAAVVCPTCPASFTLRELKLAQKSVLGDLRPAAVSRRLAEDALLAELAADRRRDSPATTPSTGTDPIRNTPGRTHSTTPDQHEPDHQDRTGTGRTHSRRPDRPVPGRSTPDRPALDRPAHHRPVPDRTGPDPVADSDATADRPTSTVPGTAATPPPRDSGRPTSTDSRARPSTSRRPDHRTTTPHDPGPPDATDPQAGRPASRRPTPTAPDTGHPAPSPHDRRHTTPDTATIAAAAGDTDRTPTSPRDSGPGGSGARPPGRRLSTIAMAARIRSVLGGSEPAAAKAAAPELPPGVAASVDPRPVWWCKSADPDLAVPDLGADVDARVLLPDLPAFDGLRARLDARGVPHRSVRHWVEHETVVAGRAQAALSQLGGVVADDCEPVGGDGAVAARLAFETAWNLHDPVAASVPDPVPVPARWARYLPFPLLNPAQAQAAPHLLDGDSHVVVTAPTGAGKTTMGMLAVLRAVLDEGRKAAWLVPQRSLTDELDRELETWRDQGLRVERLSGEYAVDVEAVKAADLWVATTEKFEAICRASSLQAAIGEVGCLVVDEIHLLGSPGRGALLEALLARVRGADSPVRIVGLSATVSNAAELAEWLEADLVTTTWRPSRVTWQLPTLPASSAFGASGRLREQAVVDLVHRHTAERGSVLVFCGSKRNVRSTAMAVAAERGAAVHTVAADDADGLARVCAEVGVRLHYAGYEHRHAAERAFRSREADVLVATSTVAAGVNLPARAVIVRDTTIGGEPLDTSTVLQMFGRAGRVGAGETEGWSYLLVDETERAAWQTRLVSGYAVYSRIRESLPDHVLAEVLQGRITTVDDAAAWWVETLAHAQGDDDAEPVREAVDFLVDEGHLTADGDRLAITEPGRLTARMMVSTAIGHRLRRTLGLLPVPTDPDSAEDALCLVLSVAVRDLAGLPVPEHVRPAVATVIKAGGRTSRITGTTSVKGLGSQATTAPGDLAWAGLLLAARSPHVFTSRRRVAGGIPLSTLYPVYDQAPRFLAWLAAQGVLGTVHPWIAIVAADLDQRVRWRTLGARRGSGRLLWMCEQLATRATDRVPDLWRSATARGVTSPDWPPGRSPAGSQLDHAGYTALLRERATTASLTTNPDTGTATGLPGASIVAWRGDTFTTPVHGKSHTTTVPYPEGTDPDTGIAVFTRRGDYRATGWLSDYHATNNKEEDETEPPPPRSLGRRRTP